MVTLYKVPKSASSSQPYRKKQDVDTRIPPKAKPLFNKIAVNGVAIAEADILHEAQNHPANNPGEALLAAARALVVRELLWQEAKRLKFEQMTSANNDDIHETTMDQAISRLINHEIKVPTATLEHCRKIYDQRPGDFHSDTIWEARHILLVADAKNTDAYQKARDQAVAIIKRLQQDRRQFAELAKLFSRCTSAEQGGNLGQLSRGSTAAEFEAVLMRVKAPCLIETPVETRYGVHVVEIMQIIPGERLPFEIAQEKIAAWLEASSWSRAVSQYIGVLAQKAVIEGFEVLPADGSLIQ